MQVTLQPYITTVVAFPLKCGTWFRYELDGRVSKVTRTMIVNLMTQHTDGIRLWKEDGKEHELDFLRKKPSHSGVLERYNNIICPSVIQKHIEHYKRIVNDVIEDKEEIEKIIRMLLKDEHIEQE